MSFPKEKSLSEKYTSTRNYTTFLCTPLNEEDYVIQVVEFASPPKWHLAHTTWFFEEFVLLPFLENYEVFDSRFQFLFNSYYNNVGAMLARNFRGAINRPTVEEVYAYRKYVDNAMASLLQQTSSSEIEERIVLGLNHEQQHQELLLSDLKFAFSKNPCFPVYKSDFIPEHQKINAKGTKEILEGVYEVGFNGDGFCYDNEKERHKVYLRSFGIEKAPVSNAEYMEFMNAGGYDNSNFWLDEGWNWKCRQNSGAPLYWKKQDQEWFHFTLGGQVKIDEEAPVCHLNFYEAAAFAAWRGTRLPTEFEWEVASAHFEWGLRWEWTQSAYLPYPGFKKAEGAIGEYNGKFMLNQQVLRGASIATSAHHSRNTYRNFFHANSQWQFSGVRLIS